MKIGFIGILLIGVQLSFGQTSLQFFGQPESLNRVNSQYDENFISIHPSNEALVVTRRNYPGNIGDRHNPGDIWVSQFDSVWLSPSSINVDPSKLVTPIGYVNQGDLFIYSTTIFDRGVFRGDLWVADYENGMLKDHKKLEIENFNNLSEHQSGSISPNGKHMIFAMEGDFTFGVEDLYVSNLDEDGKWSSPKNLGYRINTSFQEYTPFLAADNETLIFASNGREGGYGSFDLYASTRIDNTWQNWTEPVNLGPTVNSKGAETSMTFVHDSDYAYYSSTTDSDGYGDIKRIRITTDMEEVVTEVQTFEIKEEPVDSEKVFYLVDKSGDQVISGTILLLGEGFNEEISSGTGILNQSFPDLTVETRAEGFLNHVTHLTSSQLSASDTFRISVDALAVGNTINLEHVLFHQGTANFIEGSEVELDRVAEMLKENPSIKILLKGHTDNRGDAQLNVNLSRERVRVVVEYLQEQGIGNKRITGKGYGGNDPIAPNDSEENRRLNRRVEFTIVEN